MWAGAAPEAVAIGLRSARKAGQNPLAPNVEAAPLKLVLDARSLGSKEGEEREEAEFLCELCWTPAATAIWSWDGNPIEDAIPQTELRSIRNDIREVGIVGQPGASAGVIPVWSQFERFSDQSGYTGREREWFEYYGPLTSFLTGHGWHYLVTDDPRLHAAIEREKGYFRRGRFAIVSVKTALFLLGLAMIAQDKFFYEAPQPGHSIHAPVETAYLFLSMDLLSTRRRLFDAMRRPDESQDEFHTTERSDLVRSMFSRVSDLLRGRTRIALLTARTGDEHAVEEAMYDVRNLIGSAVAMLDALAVLSAIAFEFDFKGRGGDSAIGFRQRVFKKELRKSGYKELAERAEEVQPFLDFLWSLRNPVFHREGLGGYTLHAPPRRVSRIVLNARQVESLYRLCSALGCEAGEWGLSNENSLGPALDAETFSDRLVVEAISTADRLAYVFADELDVPRLRTSWTAENRKSNRRLRLLFGLPSAVEMTAGLSYVGDESTD